MRADGETFAHEHADVEDADGDPVLALPGTRVRTGARPARRRSTTAGRLPALGASSGWPTARCVTVPFTVRADRTAH